MPESWKWIPGHEGKYEVSDIGRVRSFWKPTEIFLKQTQDRDGYKLVGLSRRMYRVHRLVLLAFVGPDSRLVRHLDDDPSNNSITNLRYGTSSENNWDTVAHGRNFNSSKSECKNGHAFISTNTYMSGTYRQCRTCNTANVAAYKRRKRIGIEATK